MSSEIAETSVGGVGRVFAARLTAALVLWGISYAWGFSVEILGDAFDEWWEVIFGTVVPWTLLSAAILGLAFEPRAELTTALLVGVFMASTMAIAFVAGGFLPFLLELGNRDLSELGGDLGWRASLILGLALFGLGGAALGVVVGVLAWSFRHILDGARRRDG